MASLSITPSLPGVSTDDNGGGGNDGTSTSSSSSTTSSQSPTSSPTSRTSPTSNTPSPSSPTSLATSSSPSSSTTTSQSTSTSVRVVEVTTTVNGQESISTSTSTSLLVPGQSNGGGGGGLSSGAKAGIIGGVCGAAGLVALIIAAFFIYRCVKRRRSDYVPGQEELKWPEMQEDSGALFPAAVRRNDGHGLGRSESIRSYTTAGAATSSGYPQSANSHQPYSADYSQEGGLASAQAAGYGLSSYPPRQSYYEPQLPPHDEHAAYFQADPDQQEYYHSSPEVTDDSSSSGAALDRNGSVVSRPEGPRRLHIANPSG